MPDLTSDEIRRRHELLYSDPAAYIRLTTDDVNQNQNDSAAYFSRHYGWLELGQPERALEDLTRSLNLEPHCATYKCRGSVYFGLGRLDEAKADFLRGQALDPREWNEIFGDVSLASCHARLGDEVATLSFCQNLPEDHWSPPTLGVRGGGKAAVVESLKQILNAHRR